MYNVVNFYSSLFLEHLKIWYFWCGKNSCLAVEAFKVVISMQSLLVHFLISSSCLTLLWVDQRLRELCLRAPAGKIFPLLLAKCHILRLFVGRALFEEEALRAIKAECNVVKLAELPGLWEEIKRQEVKSRNLASRVHFLLFCPIEISHCGQTKHRWQQHWKYRNTKNIAKTSKTCMNPKYLKSILWPFQGQGWAMSILW